MYNGDDDSNPCDLVPMFANDPIVQAVRRLYSRRDAEVLDSGAEAGLVEADLTIRTWLSVASLRMIGRDADEIRRLASHRILPRIAAIDGSYPYVAEHLAQVLRRELDAALAASDYELPLSRDVAVRVVSLLKSKRR